MAKAAVEESTSPTLTPFPPSLISPLLAQYLPSTSILNPSPTPIPSVADLHAVRAELLKYKDRLKERFRTTELNEIALRNYKVGNVNGQSTNVPNLTTPSNIPIIKSKGKEKERSSSVTPIPTSVPLNSIAPVTSHPLIKSNSKQARANSGGFCWISLHVRNFKHQSSQPELHPRKVRMGIALHQLPS